MNLFGISFSVDADSKYRRVVVVIAAILALAPDLLALAVSHGLISQENLTDTTAQFWRFAMFAISAASLVKAKIAADEAAVKEKA